MNYKRILIVQTAFIGDVILITPLIRETKKLFPEAVIDVLVQSSNKSVLKHNPYINEIICLDKSGFNLKGFVSTLFKLSKSNYDLALTPHRSLRTLLLLFLAGVKERYGFNQDYRKHLLTKNFKHPRNVHKAEKNLGLLSNFTDQKPDWHSELYFTQEEENKAEKYIESENSIAIAPGSVWATKRWPEEYYVRLVELLNADGYRLVFIGSKAEKELADRIISEAGITAINSCGELSITESAALLSKCRALICNDSGALHIGNAVKIPVFAFFGPTVKRYGYYPYGDNDILFEVDLDCRPCGMHGHKKCPLGHHNCMKFIKPDKVFSSIRQKLSV